MENMSSQEQARDVWAQVWPKWAKQKSHVRVLGGMDEVLDKLHIIWVNVNVVVINEHIQHGQGHVLV